MSSNREKSAENSSWYSLTATEVVQKLAVDAREGLDSGQARQRLEEYGANRLPEEKKKNIVLRFLAHFHDVLIYILLASAIVTALLDHWMDTWVILGVVIINAIVGFIQEGKAEKALEGIRQMLSLKAQVVRDGRRQEINAEDLVPGDLVIISSGDKIPADVRLLEVTNLRIEESALTGESEEVEKQVDEVAAEAGIGDRLCMAYSGTTVRYGSARAVVTATGAATELGKINTMMTETQTMTTPLIRKINQFGKGLSVVIIVFAALLFAFGYFIRNLEAGELFLSIIGLAVAAIPEGLPAILTITLAIGVQKMARRSAIVRKLPSVETLGSVTVICSDKTGTLTRNEMTARNIYSADADYEVTGAGYSPEGEIRYQEQKIDALADSILQRQLQANLYCNESEIEQMENGQWDLRGQPTEGALLTLALKAGMRKNTGGRLAMIPFDSEHKYRAVLQDLDGKRVVLANGAPDRLLDLCNQQLGRDGLKTLDRRFWEEKIEQAARKGQRVLGSAYRPVAQDKENLDHSDLEQDLVFTGLVGIIDPPRPEAIEAIRDCHKAGIKVKMITGDHALTASVIGREMGIGDGVKSITGRELEKMDDEELAKATAEHDIFARTSPEHKLRLVRAIQASGGICAMTGDGVNDAPALKQADIGVAMGIKGTEVTKDAAAMVLADDNFATIANAVEEGRTIYDNLRKTLLFLLPTNGAEALVVMIGIILGTTMPITPVQILWVNMVTAVTLALAISVEPAEANVMQRPPRAAGASILGRYFLWRILFVSVMIGSLTFIVFNLLKTGGHELDLVRTVALNTLVAGQMFYLFNCRSIREPALGRAFFRNRAAFAVSCVLVALQLSLTYLPFMNRLFGTAPLPAVQWLYPLGGGLIVFAVVELEKAIRRKVRPESQESG